jgi:hypothetical protein
MYRWTSICASLLESLGDINPAAAPVYLTPHNLASTGWLISHLVEDLQSLTDRLYNLTNPETKEV